MNSRFELFWQLLVNRFTTSEPLFLGVCAHLSKFLGIPTFVFRIAGLVLLMFWPFWTLLSYVIVALFIPDEDRQI